MMHSFRVILKKKLKILVFLKKGSQIAILKIEHCGFLHLLAYLYLQKLVIFIFQISNSFEKKN